MSTVALSPAASSILSLVAQNPEVPHDTVATLIRSLEPDLQGVVTEAVDILRQTARLEQPVFGESPAGIIAQAYVKWAQQNARYAHNRPVAL